jgi:hypothetical protein
VAGFNFADNYRAAGLSTSPEVLRTRQEPFEKLRKAINPPTAIDLTRLYFSLPVPRGTDWFRDAFGGEADPSFSLIENAREAAVLSAGLLEAAAGDGKVYAALAVLTASAGGLRQPTVRPDLVRSMATLVQEQAVRARLVDDADLNAIKNPAASKIAAELTNLVGAPELIPAVSLLEKVSEEASELTKTLAGQVHTVVRRLAAQVATLREEVEMLWWHIGGWSRLIDQPFVDIEIGLVAVLAGIDLADMSKSTAGPAAARALLQRTLTAVRKGRATKVTIKDAVDALPEEQFKLLKLSPRLAEVAEICPVLSAFAKAQEIGRSPTWHGAFKKATELDAGASFGQLDLALQAYRERLLVSALG